METLSATRNLVARPQFKERYDNFIGGEWVSPVKGQYFDNISPIDGQNFTEVDRST
ncbi:MAG: aldehyde dehydrogenase, partial [Sphingobacteriaceae bacterium]|nr:aldehyde dehydrogenase [Cytophagaceae bacterium]